MTVWLPPTLFPSINRSAPSNLLAVPFMAGMKTKLTLKEFVFV